MLCFHNSYKEVHLKRNTATHFKAAGEHASRLGVFRARDLVMAGYLREYLRRLVSQEQVRQLGRGLYASAGFDGDQNQSLVEAAMKVPRGVVCLVSALQFHGIGTQAPHQIWLALPRGSNRPSGMTLPLPLTRRFRIVCLRPRVSHRFRSTVLIPTRLSPLPVRLLKFALPALGAALLAVASSRAGDPWPQFRGPTGDGRSTAPELPLAFGEGDRVLWKTEIKGKGWSSPIVWEDQVWLTTATETGEALSVVCLDRETGAVVRDEVIFRVSEPQFCHKFNSYASPTPVIEEGRVYLTFGSPGTACLDTATGRVLWTRTDFVCNHFRGAGSSPILFGDLLLMNFDGSDFQYVVALDKHTGRTVWRVDRSVDFQDLDESGRPRADGDMRKAFSTPQIVHEDGKTVLLSSGAKAHYAYEPATGAEIWRLEERAQHSASTRPVLAHGMVYLQTGFSKGQLLAVKLGGSGVLDESRIVWRVNRNVGNKPSLLAFDDLIFMVDDTGIASCLEAKTGAEVWRERVPGGYSASPLLAAGRIYLFSEAGHVTVLEAGRTFKVLAENRLDSGFMASPAVSEKALILRTRTHVYRVE